MFKKSNNKICFIGNHAAHYRKEIFLLMDKELDCDFYFGTSAQNRVKKLDYNLFSSCKELKTFRLFGNWYWINSISLIFKYDIFIFTGDFHCLSGWLLILLAKFFNKKTYSWGHGWYGRETRVKKIIKKIYYGLCTSSFVYGNYARDLMIKEGFNKKKIHVVYNSLSYSEQLIYRNKCKQTNIYKEYFNNSNKNIFFVGRLIPSKNIGMLLNAINKLKFQNIFLNLTLIGEGPDSNNLKMKVKELSLENVWFYGASYAENKLSELIYNADLCVSPGEVGLTAIHSLMYGTPLITHDFFPRQGPEFEVIEKEVTGDFFEQHNEEDLVEVIKMWFNSNIDRDELRTSCFRVIDERYNPQNQIEIIKKVLSNTND